MCFMGKWWRGWTDSRNVADMQICWRWNLVYYRRTVNILEIWITFWYYLLLFTKSMFQPYSILAQVLKVEYIAIRFWYWGYNLGVKPSINYDSIFLLPRTKVHSTGFSRWIWIHFPPISFVFKGKLCLAHQKLFFRNKHLIHIEHLVYNVNLYVCM